MSPPAPEKPQAQAPSDAVRILRTIPEWHAARRPLHLALGVFDGVHLGHQEVITRVLTAARRDGGIPAVLSFHPHPAEILAPDRAPELLLADLDHKARTLASLGIKEFLPLPFDATRAAQSAEDFLSALCQAPVRTLAVGQDWRFGHGRQGDVAFLAARAAELGYQLEAVPAVESAGLRISSTTIRQAIRQGDLASATRLLGRAHAVCGSVIHGRKLGRTLGFPTANLATPRALLPPHGVWLASARLEHENFAIPHPAVANLGRRPSLGTDSETHLEAHLPGWSGSLYDRKIELRFLQALRPEQAFPSLEALQAQIQQDIFMLEKIFPPLHSLA